MWRDNFSVVPPAYRVLVLCVANFSYVIQIDYIAEYYRKEGKDGPRLVREEELLPER